MFRTIVFLIASIILTSSLQGQSFYFGPKGGASFAIQNWNGVDRDPLLTYHGDLFIESYRPGANSTLFAQLGLHNRGSSEDALFFAGGNNFYRQRQNFIFKNASVQFGAKKFLKESGTRAFYSFAVRLEYTLASNLDTYEQYAGYFPVEPFINKFNYGATLAIGYEIPFTELTGFFVEASIHPDLSKQYEQPGGIGVISPLTGQGISLREESIRNISFEISVGFKFLRKVIYLDR